MGIQIACDYCSKSVPFKDLSSAGTFLIDSHELFDYVVCEQCQSKVTQIREAARQFGKRAQKEHYEQLMSELRKP